MSEEVLGFRNGICYKDISERLHWISKDVIIKDNLVPVVSVEKF